MPVTFAVKLQIFQRMNIAETVNRVSKVQSSNSIGKKANFLLCHIVPVFFLLPKLCQKLWQLLHRTNKNKNIGVLV